MIIYIITFVISCIFCEIANENENKKGIRIVASLMAILIPSILAGVRSTNIGTDIGFYAERLFENAKLMSFKEFLGYSEVEIGYTLLVFLSAKISTNISVLLFMTEFLIVGFIYLFAYNKRREIPIWMVMITYYFFAFNSSLNIMRQSIAISIIIFSLIYMEKKKYKNVIFWFFIALAFHDSALFAIPLYIIMYICEEKKKNNTLIIMVIIVTAILTYYYQNILYFFVFDLKIIPIKYYSHFIYLSTEYDVNYFELIFKLIMMVIYFLNHNIDKNKTKEEKVYFIYLIIDLLIFPISFKVSNAIRMEYYYFYPSMIVIFPSMTRILKKDKLNQIIGGILVLILLIIYWYRIYIVLGFSETYPYESELVPFFNLKI